MDTQTPFVGDPSAPWYVSSALFGPGGAEGPVTGLIEAAVGTLERDRSSRADYRVARPDRVDDLVLLEMDIRARTHTAHFDVPGPPLARWRKSLERVGDSLATASLHGDGLQVSLWGQARDPVLLTTSQQLDDALATSCARSLADHLRSVADGPDIVGGYVDVDTIEHAYSEMVDDFSSLERFDAAVHVMGYPWALLLTEEHVGALGGVDRVLKEAPVWRAEVVGADRVLCVLTEAPLERCAEVVLPWRAFLEPVVVQGFPGPLQPRNIYRTPRPTWVFEGPMVDSQVGWALTSGSRGPRSSEVVAMSEGVVEVEVPEGPDPEVIRTILAAWARLGNVQRRTGDGGFVVDEEQLLAGEPAAFEASDEAVALAGLDRLAIGLGVLGAQVDKGGTGPFGSITVSPA